MIRFIDRQYEFGELEKLWKLKNAFVVVFGRRRIGKTRLIEEFLKDKEGVSFTAEDTNSLVQIREIKNTIADFFEDDFLRHQEIKSWNSLLSYLSKLKIEKKIYLWIDEFSYIIKNDKSAASAFQKFIDNYLRKSRVFFIVSGSLLGIMSEKVLSSSSPLYGRRTKDFLLKELSFAYANEFLKWKNIQDVLQCYMAIGGVPEYLLIASRYGCFNSFVKEEFFKKDGYFYREPYFLLSREFKEIKTYFSILNAISTGNTKPSEIANFVGIKARETYPYLELLMAYGFVKKITNPFSKRASIYTIGDPFFDFWFNFVYKNREEIEKENYKPVLKELNSFFGKRFELFVLDNFSLFFKGYRYGRWWHKDKEIDIIALNEKEKEILFAECKWRDKVDAEKVCKELVEDKIPYVKWHNKDRKENLAVFAKSFSKKIKKYAGRKVYCIELKDIEKILKKAKKQP